MPLPLDLLSSGPLSPARCQLLPACRSTTTNTAPTKPCPCATSPLPLIRPRLGNYLADRKRSEKAALDMAGKLTQQLQVRQ